MTSHHKTRALWIGTSLLLATFVAVPAASAHTTATLQMRTPTAASAPRATLFADNVVVTPGNTAPAAPAPQTVVVPQATQPAAVPAPVGEQPRTRKEVHTDVQQNHSYMSTIAISALMGGIAGVLVGGALHYIDNGQAWRNVGYWAAGGVLFGAGVGVVQVVVQESRASDAVSLKHFPTDPAPTFRLALMNVHF